MEEWRGNRFKTPGAPLLCGPRSASKRARFRRTCPIGSSAKKDELGKYLDIAAIAGLVDETASSEDAEESKPAPDIFQVVLEKLKIESRDAVAIGDTPYDASAAGKAGIAPLAYFAAGSRRLRFEKQVAPMWSRDRPRCSHVSENPCSRGRVGHRPPMQGSASHALEVRALRGNAVAAPR
jgi:hypothetical protein